MQSTQQPRKMIERMMLRCVRCAARSTPPQFVVHVMKFVVQSVMTHTFVGAKLSIRHHACHMC